MGLFDRIVKQASKIVADGVSKTVENNILNNVRDAVDKNLNVNSGTNSNSNFSNTSSSYSIPEKYNEFPKYPGNIIGRPVERETSNYSRVTVSYSGSPSQEFISTLLGAGFVKGSNVRFDKGNTYVIVDNLGNKTEVVYHIKK